MQDLTDEQKEQVKEFCDAYEQRQKTRLPDYKLTDFERHCVESGFWLAIQNEKEDDSAGELLAVAGEPEENH